MKILRIRRGYTTNSSSASEWASPTPQNGTNSGSSAQGTPIPVGGQIVLMPSGSSTPMPNNQPVSHSVANIMVVGGVVVVVAAIAALERFVTFRKRKAKLSSDTKDEE